MRKSSFMFVVGGLLLFLAWGANAQTPSYYNFDSTGGGNNFPFNVAAGKQVQWLVAAGELNRPTPVPGGQTITRIYFRANTSFSPTFTDLTVKLGQANITSLPIGVVYTGPLTTVFYRASINITATAQLWFSLTLDTPFPYDPGLGLIIDVQQCGMAGTGFSINQRTYGSASAPRRTYLTSAPCPQVYSGQDGTVAAFGVDVIPSGIPGWSAQTSGVTTPLNSVKTVSQSVVWVAGNGGVVLRTTNGGLNWTSVGGGRIGTQDLYAIDAISATTAFVTGTPTTTTYMFRTTDGGTNWDTVFVQAGGFLDAIKMYDATNGIALGDPVAAKWVIIRTTNGGSTWARIPTEPNQVGSEAGSNNGMHTLGTTHIWFCSNSSPPKIYRSTDAGATWASSNLPGTASFTAGISFLNTQYGVSGGNNGNAARSTDGGASWNAVTVGTTGAIYSASAAGTLNFWVTRGTTIQKSADRGANWAQDFSDATAGTFNHSSFVTTGGTANGWAVTASGKIYAYYNPVDLHDLGVTSLAKLILAGDKPAAEESPSPVSSLPEQTVDAVSAAADPSGEVPSPPAGLALQPVGRTTFDLADTVRFRAIVKNFGTFNEPTYQVGWQIDGVAQTTVNRGPIAAGANDTLTLQWNQGVTGLHTARAWTILATDGNRANDTASLNFSVGQVPGDTLYNFRILPTELLLGIAKLPSHKLVITSGGTSNVVTTDNKWVVTTMRGTLLDTTHYQINNTAGQGFGFRDLAWDGRWLLTSDNPQVRRIDTATFTEILPAFTAPGALQRGLAAETRNRIWKSNFTTDPVVQFDSTGVQTKSLGVPTVAPYGIAFDKWTSRNRGWLWYTQPSTAGIIRLSKVDTASGAIVATYDYSAAFPAASSSGGLDIVNDHPEYPGSVVALMVTQLGPGGVITAIYLGRDSTTVGVEEGSGEIPSSFTLQQNYPNPFNPTTTIKYTLPVQSDVTLKIYTVLGQEVATVVGSPQGPGILEATWDGRNSTGAFVGSGVYFYKLEARAQSSGQVYTNIKKMLLLK